MKRFLRDNGLTLAFLLLFALSLAGQAVAGHAEFNDRQAASGAPEVALGHYLLSSDFAVDTAENWQSEYLQFLLLIYATVWLVQRGSSESKPVDRAGPDAGGGGADGGGTGAAPAAARAGGVRAVLYSRSLALVMGAIFLLSWLAQSVAGRAAYNAQQLAQHADPVSWPAYVASADFWSRTLQNWQSEFLAVATMSIFAVYLRQRGSPESKPVGAPHSATGVED